MGSNLLFEPEHNSGECVIKGTRSGSINQLQFALVSNSTILVVPDIPSPANPWNNEYTLSVKY